MKKRERTPGQIEGARKHCLNGVRAMTPEERKAAYHAWLNPHNADLDEAAAILNVTY